MNKIIDQFKEEVITLIETAERLEEEIEQTDLLIEIDYEEIEKINSSISSLRDLLSNVEDRLFFINETSIEEMDEDEEEQIVQFF